MSMRKILNLTSKLVLNIEMGHLYQTTVCICIENRETQSIFVCLLSNELKFSEKIPLEMQIAILYLIL